MPCGEAREAEAQLVAHPGKPERGGATGGAGFDEVMLLG